MMLMNTFNAKDGVVMRNVPLGLNFAIVGLVVLLVALVVFFIGLVKDEQALWKDVGFVMTNVQSVFFQNSLLEIEIF